MKLSDETKLMLPIVLFVICFAGFFGWTLLTTRLQLDIFINDLVELKSEFSETYILKEGIVESPSVIILLENKTDFLSKLKELDAAIIYYDEWPSRCSFYVFGYEDNMLVAYRFTVSAW